MDTKKLLAYQFEVSKALRAAHHLAGPSELLDQAQAIRDLANAVATLAMTIDQMIEAQLVEEARLS